MKNLKKLREQQRATQKAVADFLGVSRVAYTNYENGIRQPGFDILKKLSKLFDVSIDYILDNAPVLTAAEDLPIEADPSVLILAAEETDLIEKYRALSPEVKDHIMNYVNFEYAQRPPETKH